MISELEKKDSGEVALILKNVYSNHASIKQEKVKELKKLDPTYAIFAKLLKIFHTEYTNRIPEMIGLCVKKDYNNLSKVIHRFKSTTYNLGASRAVELAKQTELAISKEPKNELKIKRLIILLEHECIVAHELLASNLVREN